jgi:hypothetical protein
MTKESGIKAEIFFQRERKDAARKLKGPEIAFYDKVWRAAAGANAEKRQIAPPRKGLEMAAGVRNAINLVERVRKAGDAWRRSQHSAMKNNNWLECGVNCAKNK